MSQENDQPVSELTSAERWERRAEVPMLLLAVAFLVAYAWPILDPRLDPDLRSFLSFVSWTVWAAFALDFLVRLVLADRTLDFALRRWYDVLLIALPMLRPLRLLRLIALVRILDRSAWNTLAGRTAVYVTGAAGTAIGLGALAVLQAERADPDANIRSFGDALWWACCTVTTVGYGDFYPVTTTGRVVAVVLMFLGIGVVGAVTAAVATAMLARQAEVENRRRL